MTSPEPSPTRPLRVAGLVLLGVAAIAMVIGLISLFGGNGNGQADDNDGDNEQPPASTSSSEPGSTTSPPASESTTRPPSSNGPTTTTTTTPPPGASTPPGDDGNGEPGKNQQVRVLNNSTVSGLASRAADDLREAGWQVSEVGNYPSGVIPTTTVYFRPGTAEEAAAELLADEFGMRSEPRFAGLNYGPGLIVIVTSDYQGPGGEREETDKNDK